MTRDEMLGLLQPPQPPLEPGFWPPALAWWIMLAALLLIPMLWLLWRRKLKRNHHYYQARHALSRIAEAYRQHGSSRLLLQQLAYWLRQVAKLGQAEPHQLALHGEPWLAFLDSSLPEPDFSRGPGRIFADQTYQSDPNFDCEQAIGLCHRWLAANRKKLGCHGPV